MKYPWILLFLLSISFSCISQEDLLKYEFDRNETTGRIQFSNVIEIEGVSKNELYSRARKWFSDYYVSFEAVIDLEDREEGVITGRPRGTFPYKYSSVSTYDIPMSYELSIYVKDGRFKYIATAINHVATPTQNNGYSTAETPIEIHISDERIYKKNGKKREKFAQWKIGVIQSFRALEKDIITGMSKPISGNDDW